MSDPVTITTLIIAAIPATIGSIVAAVMTLRATKLGKQTYQMVNGSMLVQLQLHAKTARSLANSVPNPANESVAVIAEKELMDHLEKKQLIDGTIER